MQSFGIFFFVVYICVLVGVGIFLLTLLSRFVSAHERIAGALENAARNLQREQK
jgi:hypothetical protein